MQNYGGRIFLQVWDVNSNLVSGHAERLTNLVQLRDVCEKLISHRWDIPGQGPKRGDT